MTGIQIIIFNFNEITCMKNSLNYFNDFLSVVMGSNNYYYTLRIIISIEPKCIFGMIFKNVQLVTYCSKIRRVQTNFIMKEYNYIFSKQQ